MPVPETLSAWIPEILAGPPAVVGPPDDGPPTESRHGGGPAPGGTHLAISIAYRAIQNGTTALFTEANRLMEELSEASKYGRLSEALEPYVHTGVLVVDEVGYLSCPPDAANVLFQVSCGVPRNVE